MRHNNYRNLAHKKREKLPKGRVKLPKGRVIYTFENLFTRGALDLFKVHLELTEALGVSSASMHRAREITDRGLLRDGRVWRRVEGV
jgi:ribosomal protein L16/L10AE